MIGCRSVCDCYCDICGSGCFRSCTSASSCGTSADGPADVTSTGEADTCGWVEAVDEWMDEDEEGAEKGDSSGWPALLLSLAAVSSVVTMLSVGVS